MPSINEIFASYKELEYAELLKRAKNDYNLLVPIFSSMAKDKNGLPYVLIFIGSALAADRRLSPLECKFLNDLFGTLPDDAEKLVKKHMCNRAADLADKVFDSCNEGLKEVLLDFCLCFLAVDENFAPEERSFVARLLA